MTLNLRDYQLDALNAITFGFKKSKDFVLASCPSSGKTTIALEYIKANPKLKVLVLPHGTHVIKQQWIDAAAGITNVNIELPQSLFSKSLNRVDLLVIDEAHEYTDAKMIKTIIAAAKPKHILYLTGTPAKFILKGTPTFIVAAEEIVPTYVSDLYLGLFSTTAKLTDKDYNKKLDVVSKKERELTASAENDLNNLIKAMLVRLKETKFLKDKTFPGKFETSKMRDTFNLFTKLEKTMIACHNEKQLKRIESVLLKNGVKVICSISKDDYGSDNINNFETSDENVLLVLRRGILGYNMTSLINVVDMTGSHNINRIYQLYARVMRQHPEKKQKYFFKLTSTADMQVTNFYMNAAINLMRKDFISKYNGKNLNAMEIRVLKIKKSRSNTKKPKIASIKGKSLSVDPFFYGTVMANQLLESVYNKQSNVFNEYANMRIGKLKEIKFETKEHSPITNITEKQFINILKTGIIPESIYE